MDATALLQMITAFKSEFDTRTTTELGTSHAAQVAQASLASAQAAVLTAQTASDTATKADGDAVASVEALLGAFMDAMKANDDSVFWKESGLTPPGGLPPPPPPDTPPTEPPTTPPTTGG